MKKLFISFLVLASYVCTAQHTEFVKTDQKFRNGEYVYNVVTDGKKVGEFWPIQRMSLETRETLGSDSLLNQQPLPALLIQCNGVAAVPGSMSTDVSGTYQMEGKSLSGGIPCGDDYVYEYGIVIVSKDRRCSNFTHSLEKTMQNFDSVYASYQQKGSTLFFLPSIFRNGIYRSKKTKVDKVLIRRWVPNTDTLSSGEQIGVILFDKPTTYDNVRTTVVGLDRNYTDGTVRSKTTHIYVLDGGDRWGQSVKKVNGKVVTIGTREPGVNTNYLVIF